MQKAFTLLVNEWNITNVFVSPIPYLSKKEKMAKSYEIKYAKEQKFNQTRDTGTKQTLGEEKKKLNINNSEGNAI